MCMYIVYFKAGVGTISALIGCSGLLFLCTWCYSVFCSNAETRKENIDNVIMFTVNIQNLPITNRFEFDTKQHLLAQINEEDEDENNEEIREQTQQQPITTKLEIISIHINTFAIFC